MALHSPRAGLEVVSMLQVPSRGSAAVAWVVACGFWVSGCASDDGTGGSRPRPIPGAPLAGTGAGTAGTGAVPGAIAGSGAFGNPTVTAPAVGNPIPTTGGGSMCLEATVLFVVDGSGSMCEVFGGSTRWGELRRSEE